MTTRDKTRRIQLGNVEIGGGAPVSVQTMCNTDTRDAAATADQIKRCMALGCDIVRLAVPDQAAAEALPEIRRRTPGVPLVADGLLCDCAVLASDGEARGVVPKTKLSAAGGLCEARVFSAPSAAAGRSVRLSGRDVPFRAAALWVCRELPELCVGCVPGGDGASVLSLGSPMVTTSPGPISTLSRRAPLT